VAAGNPVRERLFKCVGVEFAVPSNVISMIHEKYAHSILPSPDDSVAHLKYLYWNLPFATTRLNAVICLLDQNLDFMNHREKKYLYFEDEDEYGPKQIFQPVDWEGHKAPGLTVHFLNAIYYSAVPAEARHHGRSWRQWFEEVAGVYRYPQLRNPSHLIISEEFEYIIEHRSEKLVGLLEHFWSCYEPQITHGIAITKTLAESLVPSGGATMLLEETFLPLPRLLVELERLCVPKLKFFPFLTLPEELTEANQAKWQFLERFGVRSGNSNDLYFYVELLNAISLQHPAAESSVNLEGLFELYGLIERHCLSTSERQYVQ